MISWRFGIPWPKSTRVRKSEMSIVPFRSQEPLSEGQCQSDPVQSVEEIVDISEVSIFAEDGPNGKSSFSILLKFGQDPDPSTRRRRTATVTGLTLGVEDKEIPVLARLAGRSMAIFVEKSTASVQQEDLEQKIRILQNEVLRLQEKNHVLSQNLHHLVEESYKAS